MLSNSHEYLNMCGHTVLAWMWLKQEHHACRLLRNHIDTGKPCQHQSSSFARAETNDQQSENNSKSNTNSDENQAFSPHFLKAKRSASAYFFKYELPKTVFQAQLLSELGTFIDDAAI